MQIALTKALADSLNLKPPAADDAVDPLYCWTATWTNAWDNRKSKDLLLLVNHATKFVVVVYEFRKKHLKNIQTIMLDAINHTLQALNFQQAMIDDYLRLAGEVTFVKNQNRKVTSWLNQAVIFASQHLNFRFADLEKVFDDTTGAPVSRLFVTSPTNLKSYITPFKEMREALAKATAMKPYDYKAFELLISLDLEQYKAERRIIVNANLPFFDLHKIIQDIFEWREEHLYQFLFGGVTKLLLYDPYEAPEFFEGTRYEPLMDHKLSDFVPDYESFLYEYDFGDGWYHEISLIRVIEHHDQDSPYLLEASGKAPPENVGGVGGFLEFKRILEDPSDEDHTMMQEWAEDWTPELNEWVKKPRIVF